MKFVYVLTSKENDYYLEECIISMLSLKKYNPKAEIILLMDDRTEKTLVGFRGKVREIASKVITEHYDDKITQKARSRLLKTSMRRLVSGKFLFIDIDTVIADSLEINGDLNADIAMVLDKHVLISEHYLQKVLRDNAKRMNYAVGFEDKHFNSGVIYVNDSIKAHQFFDLWNLLYKESLKKQIDIDQVSLNEANARMKGVISELDGTWNVQINCGLKYISEAKIIHYLGYQPMNRQNIYFNTLPFRLCDKGCIEEMKRQEHVTEEIDEIISHPKTAFKTVAIIPDDCVAYQLVFSNHMRILKFIYIKLKFIYMLSEKLYGKLFRYIFKRV